MGISSIVFIILLLASGYIAWKRYAKVYRNIRLGKDEEINGDISKRIKNTLLIAFGQKKMFKRPLLAFMHLIVYAGFLIVNIELLEIVIDGLFGTHRIFQEPLGSVYTFLINFFRPRRFRNRRYSCCS